ncbi:MAG: FAD-dependent oxidoreductase, partial [Candidatus Eisenbacteria bacterium]|nr:FAD-dependent oxidoreductase [Candidatus Eisenbacteria bacterium]
MALIKISLNGKDVEVESGSTILQAARAHGIEIPTLCNDDQLEPFASCWVCAVKLEGMRRYVPSCGTRVSPGMKVWTNTEEVEAVRRMALELLLSNHRGDCVAPCKAACPAGVDVQGYIALISQGQYREATRLVKEVNPFPLSIGRVCTRPCEKECRRNAVDGPVGIDYLKRFAADWDISHADPYSPPVARPTGKKVAAVGAGPASLTLAYYLSQKGHSVTVFEALPAPGGMLRYGIPEYRLPKRTLDKEIDLITSLGAKVEYGRAMGRAFTLADLFQGGYDAIFLGLGAMGSRKMKVPGEELEGVWAGTEFLKQMGLGERPKIGRHVAVIGGGNTAVDAARTSLRLGADKVTIVYRRSRKEMPAWDVEVDAAEHEGVEMHFLAAPTKIEGDGRCERLEYVEMELGEPDDSGRRRPVPIEGSEKMIEVDNVIAAIGQMPDLAAIEGTASTDPGSLEARLELTRWGTIVADESTGATSVERVFAGGDVVSGAATAIEAIAAGGRAAKAIDRLLAGENIALREPYFNIRKERWDSLPEEELADVEKAPRQEMPELSVAERVHTFDEVELGYTEDQAIAETGRCLECGCEATFTCKLRRYAAEYNASWDVFDGDIVHDRPDTRHPFIRLEPEKCILCARCVRVCEDVQGAAALGFFRRGFDTQMKPALDSALAETSCESCGQCVASCPTAALSPIIDLPKPGPWETRHTRSTCGFCGTGCGITASTVGKRLVEVTPVPTGPDGFTNLCVRGRFGTVAVSGRGRLTRPLLRGRRGLETSSWDDTVKVVTGALGSASKAPDSVATFISPRLTNEEAWSIVKLARHGLGATSVGSFGLALESKVFGALGRVLGRPASTASYESVRGADCILLLDSDLAEEQTVLGTELRKAVRRGARFIVVSPEKTRMAKLAHVWIRAEQPRYGDVLACMIGRALSRAEAGKGLPFRVGGLEELRRLAAVATPNASVSSGTFEDASDLFIESASSVLIASVRSFAPASAERDALLAVACSIVTDSWTADRGGILFMRARANGQGLADMGVGPGTDALVAGIEQGTVKAALIVGEDPMRGSSDPERLREALGRLEFLCVADVALTETGKLAHCVLPLAAPTESGGTFTNSERRVQAVNGPVPPPGGLTNLRIIARMAEGLGMDAFPEDEAVIREDLASSIDLP